MWLWECEAGVCTEVAEPWGLSLYWWCLGCPVAALELTLPVLMDVDRNSAPAPCTGSMSEICSGAVEGKGKDAKYD